MKPENIKTINRSRGEARVKTLIRAHLYWLSGFPYRADGGVYWCCPALSGAEKQKITVTSKMLSKAHRIINELIRDYPVVLPRVVGDTSVWEKRCKQYLEFTKSIYVNPQNATADSLVNTDNSLNTKIKKRYEEKVIYCELGIANSWMHYIDREFLDKSFEFISKFRDGLLDSTKNDIITQSKLCRIYMLDNGKSSGFVKLYLRQEGFSVATNDGESYINPFVQYRHKPKKNKLFKHPIRPSDNTAKQVLESVDWILELSSKQRKRALSLLDGAEIDKLINSYLLWWQAVDQLVAKISNLIKYPDENKLPILRDYQVSLKRYLEKYPEDFDMTAFFFSVKEISENSSLSNAFCEILNETSKVSEDSTLKPRLLIYLKESLDNSDVGIKYFTDYINAFTKYLRDGGDSSILSPWGRLKGSYWCSCESDVFNNLKAPQLNNFFETLLLIKNRVSEELSKDWIEGISMIVASGNNVEEAASLSMNLIKKKKIEELSKVPLRIACEQKYNLERTTKLIDIWNKFDEEYTDDDTLEVIYKTFRSINASEIFNELIFSKKLSIIRHCSNQIRVIRKVDNRQELPKIDLASTKSDRWIDVYPSEFHPIIAKLNYMCSTAEKRVRKIFLKHWWPEEFLKLEIEELTAQLTRCEGKQHENIVNRIENIKQRLKLHALPTEAIFEKLQCALSECLKNEQLNCWRDEVDNLFKRCWVTFLDISTSQLPDWLMSEEMIRYLLPVVDFNIRSRNLAKYVIKYRFQSDDWLFLEHPKNILFLEQLRKDGFDTKVWCEGIGKVEYHSKSSKDIAIDVVNDPLEILNMGGYFKTCLSPGSFNYFSVFSNIADINKQVIYGKSADGKIVGRVLIGLMPSGGVKVFNIYAHQADDEFNANVLKYIKAWVEESGFTLSENGEVPKLVSTEWYDDGAISVDNTIKCIKKGSKFRKSLATIETDSLEKALTTELNPLPINELTFPLVVRLPEIDKRPDLFPVLIKIAQKIPRFGEYEIINLFNKAHDTSYGEQCYQAFRRQLMNSLLRTVQEQQWFEPELAYRMAHYNPSDALRVVKKQGNNWKGNWQDNLNPASAKVAVKSLNMLGRPQQAEKIAKKYKIAAD